MKLIYTTGWTRESVRTAEQYQTWLASLKDNDHVLLQRFFPIDKNSFPFEHWGFESHRVWGDKLIPLLGSSDRPFVRETGKACYWNSDAEWGEVFPARVVPIHSDMNPPKGEEWFGHAPIYEPVWFNGTRYIFLMEYGDHYAQSLRILSRSLTYFQDVYGGKLCTHFAEHGLDPQQWIDSQGLTGVRFLYSAQNPD